ncbi:tRNA (5-methylaminomethyl-2-thiouridine)(34)-methyltransferase MnmD [Alkalicaulis satelles]|uniref:tRNA 5-methylaminomethyl-2-thiouridine biosynthesis bifunctional protein MnmC n=1 Tax=Alkalicaulis satelles TaxID=2609175 RepID=A0A5M6ZL33_9PROT|nr:tRNA (5-methylaminomethyl-2-thiouridine)(34)-methyltransferase MnmD [Alkalicaulis satelles]KAA5803928.1 tRNA (5-methylaminomethyl-2-thiouridine)(34)-methyltransferase MnmD [Alkalicaulis satelles]
MSSHGSDTLTLKRPHARLDWSSGLAAADMGDVYFQPEDGLAEARAVYVAGAGYPERFHDGVNVAGELGFGAGLNFLALWDALRRHAPAGARLHFVSVEGFPLARADARRALAMFPELEALSGPLVEAWPSPHCGPHRRVFEGGRVTLTVWHDEAARALEAMDMAADAWFLDGFAPSKNPDMWTPALMARIGRLSKPGARVATFTVAGAVRRALADAGFAVSKQPGFGRKRERLEAVCQGPQGQAAPGPLAPARPLDGPLAVVGGGIAAASLVDAFSRRGREVSVLAEGGWASGASGAPLGLLTPRLEAADRPHGRALLAAFDFAAHRYADLAGWRGEGVLRLGEDARLQRLAGALDEDFVWLEAQAAHERTGWTADGLFMARAGSFEPARLVQALAGGAPARDALVAGIEETQDGVRLTGADGHVLGEFAGVILAGGAAGRSLLGSALPLEPGAGRVAVFDSDLAPRTPAAWGGYAAAAPRGLMAGATHDKGDDPGDPARAEALLRALAAEGPPGLAEALGPVNQSWAGVRAAAADRLPVTGPVASAGFDEIWRAWARGAVRTAPEPGAGLSRRVMALSAFGARGFAHAPLLAEALASALGGEPAALERAGMEALHPARLAFRALRRSV